MKILGISAFYHDSAASLVIDGEIVAAVQEERFSRKKHDDTFPKNAIEYCLKEAGITLNDLDAIAFYDKPLLKFERLLETYYAFAPKGFFSFLKAMPIWMQEKIFFKKMIYSHLNKIEKFNKKKVRLLFPEHHLSHAASAFYPSNFEESIIVTIDGVGEWSTASICYGNKNNIELKEEMHFPHSVGLLYSAFTYYCGFKVNSGEYKLMGLAPYGNLNDIQTQEFISIIKNKLCTIFNDGSIFLHQQYFDYSVGDKMTNNNEWEKLFKISQRKEEKEITQDYCNMALAIQKVTEEIVIKIIVHAKEICGSKNLCLAGGVALNCVINGEIEKQKIVENLYIQPASGDAGGALGAALAAHYIYFKKERIINNTNYDAMHGSYLGPQFSDLDIYYMAKKQQAVYEKFEDRNNLYNKVATLIAEGNVVGWMQGRAEFGPRALGNRSILANARNIEMQKKLNLKIKFRESFRPFAPSVLEEDANTYFEMEGKSPYMLLVKNVKNISSLPENYSTMNMLEKLNQSRSFLPAITHIDNTARIQTVSKKTNLPFYNLLTEFKKQTNCSVLINTSFNVRGEPIVNNPEDAFICFMRTDMDILVIENYLFYKSKQKNWNENEDWKSILKTD